MHWLSSLLLTVVLIAILISILLVYRIRKQSVYFRENGIPDLGSRFFQTLWFLAGSGNIVTLEEDVYREAKQLKAPCVGATDIFGMQSTLFITDLDLIKAICVKDFYHFVTRRTLGKQMANGFFDKLLFFMEGHQWKGVRSKLSPAFTTGRLRKIFQTFNNSGIKMERYLQSELDREGESSIDFDLSKLFSKYSLDVISSCAFGVDGKLWEVGPGEMSEIERMGVEFGFKFSWKLIFKLILVSLVPKLVSALGINMNVWESQDFFTSIIKAVIKKRRQDESERRDDFLQLMLDAQQNLLEADDESDKIMNGSDEVDISTMQSSDKKPIVLDDDVVVANSMAFLVAGFDSTHTLLQCFFYSLALNPTVQDKLHKEITTVLEKHGQMATYDAISEMTYLEMTLNETMRRFPTSPRAERMCTKDYQMPGSSIVIPKGKCIVIPIYGTHMDPDYFSDPEKFIPERFSKDNKLLRNPYAFLPFGHGPRNCIATRFATLQLKTGIIQLVKSFEFKVCSKTNIPLEYDRAAGVKPKGGTWLNISRRL